MNAGLTYDNANLGISTGLFLNQVGEMLSTGAAVGDDGTPDVYTTAHGSLDFTFRWKYREHITFGLKLKNILEEGRESVYRRPNGEEVIKTLRPGARVVGFSLGWKW
mgnify:CR=1 FL=1